MEEFPDLASFLEHVSSYGRQRGRGRRPGQPDDAARGEGPGIRHRVPARWENGLMPNQRALDESGRAGLEEERRLPMSVSPGRASGPRSRSRSTAASTACGPRPCRAASSTSCPRPASRCSRRRRAFRKARRASTGRRRPSARPIPPRAGSGRRPRPPARIATARAGLAGEGAAPRPAGAGRSRSRARWWRSPPARRRLRGGGAHLPHQIRTGSVAAVDGNKLTVDFDKAGRKMVLDSFVQPGSG